MVRSVEASEQQDAQARADTRDKGTFRAAVSLLTSFLHRGKREHAHKPEKRGFALVKDTLLMALGRDDDDDDYECGRG